MSLENQGYIGDYNCMKTTNLIKIMAEMTCKKCTRKAPETHFPLI